VLPRCRHYPKASSLLAANVLTTASRLARLYAGSKGIHELHRRTGLGLTRVPPRPAATRQSR